MAATEFTLPRRLHARGVSGSDAVAIRIGRLYEQHYRMIRALCLLLLRDPVEAEDAAQQTFVSAFRSLIDGTVLTQPAPWLATIARRECWARAAQRQRCPLALDESNAAAAGGDPLEDAIRNADLAALWHAINSLPRPQRRAFLMREFSGLSYAEIAEALGATESAIESLLVRARRQLRDRFESTVAAAILLNHRLIRLLGDGAGAPSSRPGITATAGFPLAAKLAVTAAAVVAIGSAGARLTVVAADNHREQPATLGTPIQPTRSDSSLRTSGLPRLLGPAATARRTPRASVASAVTDPTGRSPATAPATTGGASHAPANLSARGTEASYLGSATSDTVPDQTTSPAAGSAPATDTPAADTSPPDASTAYTAPAVTPSTDTSAPEAAPTDPAPADTTPAIATDTPPDPATGATTDASPP